MSTYFIGDVHGCADELERLLDTLSPGAGDQVFLTGDAFDRGPDPPGVLDLIQERNLHSVQSNHETHLYQMARQFLRHGRYPDTRPYVVRCLESFGERLGEFLRYVATLPMYREGQDGEDRPWILVHAGIHPYEGLEGSDQQMLLTMRRWPMRDREAPPWYLAYMDGPVVIFGHNARKDAVLHRVEGRLLAAGLDTGCVYGGRLTALHLEEERLVQVPARRPYAAGKRRRAPAAPATAEP